MISNHRLIFLDFLLCSATFVIDKNYTTSISYTTTLSQRWLYFSTKALWIGWTWYAFCLSFQDLAYESHRKVSCEIKSSGEIKKHFNSIPKLITTKTMMMYFFSNELNKISCWLLSPKYESIAFNNFPTYF